MSDDVVIETHTALDPAALSARAARRILRQLLTQGQRPDWIDDAELAVSEIVTNAVLHAHTAVELTARLTPTHLRVEVRDYSPALPEAHSDTTMPTTGRGMALVAAITADCGIEYLGAEGKVVWFTVSGQGAGADNPLERWEVDPPDELPLGQPVVLSEFPPALWEAAREHHDAILRELTLYRATHPELPVSEQSQADADLARHLVSAALDQALRRGASVGRRLDLALSVPPERHDGFAVLQDVLDEADRLAADGLLLVRPALVEIVAFRDWVCEQVIAQSLGAPAAPWPGAAVPAFAGHEAASPAPDWDPAAVTAAGERLIAVDDSNRILAVSAPLAALLGWTPDALTGRRLVTIIPPRLREQHVAGFSHHLATGRRRFIGTTVEVPVLHHDGHEVAVRLTIDEERAGDARLVFVGRIDPAGEEAAAPR